jgi:hypothetical protein
VDGDKSASDGIDNGKWELGIASKRFRMFGIGDLYFYQQL